MGENHVVVVDYPWDRKSGISGQSRMGKFRELPYKTMTDAQIRRFDLERFMAPDCDVFLWTTHAKLGFTIQLLGTLGLKYRVVMTWIKPKGITMQGIYRNSEFVVVGYRGKSSIEKTGTPMRTAFVGKHRGHSVKPDEFYEMIRRKTAGPRIDVFARRRHPGFGAWGDQVEPEKHGLFN